MVVVVAGTVGPLLPSSRAADPSPLTLERCLEMAQARTLSLRASDEDVAAARAASRRALVPLLPKLSAGVDYTWRDRAPFSSRGVSSTGRLIEALGPLLQQQGIDPQALTQELAGGGGGDVSPSLSSRGFFDLNARIRAPLFDAAGYFGYRSAGQVARAQEAARAAEWNRARARVKQLFYAVIRGREEMEIGHEAEQIARESYEATEALFRRGKVSRLDADRARVEWVRVRTETLRLGDVYRLAAEALYSELDAPPEARGEVTGSLDAGRSLPSEDEAETLALARRPEVAEIGLGRIAAEYAVRSAGAQRWPVVSAQAGYAAQNEKLFEGPEQTFDTFSAGATFALPLFDGGLARANLDEARARLRKIDVGRRQLENQVRLDVSRARILAENAGQRVEVSSANVEAALANFAVARERHRGGLMSLLELQDIQLAYVAARTQHLQALYDRAVALTELERAMGVPIEEWWGGGAQ